MSEGLARVESLRKFMETPVFPEMPSEDRVQDDARSIERYEGLLEFKQWRELWPNDVRAPSAPFKQVLEAQRLMYARALSPEWKGDAADCKRILEKDYRFWRMVLAESSSATVKMFAARSIEQHFELGNLVVRSYPPALTMMAIPDGWREPLRLSKLSTMTPTAPSTAVKAPAACTACPTSSSPDKTRSASITPGSTKVSWLKVRWNKFSVRCFLIKRAKLWNNLSKRLLM